MSEQSANSTRRPITPLRRWATVGAVALLVLAIDQLTKWWAVDRLCDSPYCPEFPDRAIDLFWTLRFNYAENTGMAFSQGSGGGRIIAIVVLCIVGALIWLARSVRSTAGLVLIGVVIGGAFGNLFDRLFRATEGLLTGGVVDFIDVQWWPIFNVADAAVVIGGILIAVMLLREPVDEPPDAVPPDAVPPDEAPVP